jgi:hypothetical protein
MGLAMGVALRLVELLVEALEFLFQFGDAAIILPRQARGWRIARANLTRRHGNRVP